MRSPRRRTIVLSAACCAALAGAAPGLVPAAAAASQAPRTVVRGTHPAWAVRAAEVAKAPKAKPIHVRVYLSPRNQAALDRAVTAVSTPGTNLYRHFITPAQYRAEYDATPAAIAKVTAWLRGAGLSVSAPQQNGRYLDVSGSVAGAQRAFGTDLSLYRRDGGTYQAPADSISIPAAVSPYVLTVSGLDEAPAQVSPKVDVGTLPSQYRAMVRQKSHTDSAFPPGFRNANPCSSYYGQVKASVQGDFSTPLPKFQGKVRPYAVCGYRPDQLRSAYGAPQHLTGKGVTVAVIDAYMSPTLVADANHYARNSGDQPFASGQFKTLLPAGGFRFQADCDAPGWSVEQSLDVEAVHGFAPGATLLYGAARSCSAQDLYDAAVNVVDDNRASIISISFGGVETDETTADAVAETALLKQAALQGIGVYNASGDNGDEFESTGVSQVDTSANDPYATAVGATSLGIGSQGQYLFETGWGTLLYSLSGDQKSWVSPIFFGGAGGGFSNLFNRPSYQDGVVPARSPVGRAVPDVSMVGDLNTGMKIGLTQQFPNGNYYSEYRAGGTSLSAPLFASVQALTSQAQHTRLGFANPRIYALARRQLGSSTAPKVFRDVTGSPGSFANVRADFVDGVSAASGIVYTVRSFDNDTSLTTTPGWDDVTGVGTPTAAYYTASGDTEVGS